ncbi:zinc finger protein 420-like [Equus quagga]|uniref:zinc finger protein 420-like n=1 Tax=Equus quagga TaxID=89248 RepID=UPI001EE2A9AD|nr:zinc finger protein 420-like [Equus quagga]
MKELTPQKSISEEAILHNMIVNSDFKDWKLEDEINHQENQDKLLNHVAFIDNKSLTEEIDHGCNALGKVVHVNRTSNKHIRGFIHSHIFAQPKMLTSEKSYKCIQCGKAFSRKSELIVHQRIHTGEKPYESSECRKAFIQESQLIVHQRIHTGMKPFECIECEKAFSRKSHLTIYHRIHTGEQPCECSDCRKAFSQKSNLIVHQKIYVEQKPFSWNEKTLIQSSKFH